MDSFAFYISVLRKKFTQYCSGRLAEMNVTYGQLFILIFVGKKGKMLAQRDFDFSGVGSGTFEQDNIEA